MLASHEQLPKIIVVLVRGGSRTAATSKMEHFVIIVITKRSILDVAAVLDPPLLVVKTQLLQRKHVIIPKMVAQFHGKKR